MGNTMKVLQIVGTERVEMIEMPVPEPRGRQVRIKRLGIVTCNAYDLHIYLGQSYPNEGTAVNFPYDPGGPGHEWVGIIDQVGPETSLLKEGDWVCLPGGRGEDGPYPGGPGGYAPYSVLHETRLIKVPPKEIPKLAPFEMATCMAANMIDLRAMHAIEGKRTAVIGLGPAGIIGAQMLRAEGAAQVIGLDLDAKRREYALSKGIVDLAINPAGEDGKSLPLRRRGGPNAVIETSVDCAGAPAAIRYLLEHTQNVVTLFAVQHGPVAFDRSVIGGLKIHGHPGRDFESAEYALDMVANDRIDLSLTISHTMRLEQYPAALELIKSQQSLKVLFTFDERDW